MFKNQHLYRIGAAWQPSATAIEAVLQSTPFLPCAPTQASSCGWVPPRGIPNGSLLEVVGGQWLLQLMFEQRSVPGPTIKRALEERVAKTEQETGRKPGKKEKAELKEEIVHSLLPQAFPKRSTVHVWIDPKALLLTIDCGSMGRADEVTGLIVKAFDGLSLRPLRAEQSAAASMAHWLTTGEAPYNFSVDTELELKASDESKAVVWYARHMLDIDEVRQHIAGGKVPTQLALTWKGRVSFLLTASMQIKRIAFLDVVFASSASGAAEEFDTKAAISTGELSRLIPDLVDALGGEIQSLTQADAPVSGGEPAIELAMEPA